MADVADVADVADADFQSGAGGIVASITDPETEEVVGAGVGAGDSDAVSAEVFGSSNSSTDSLALVDTLRSLSFKY